MRSALKARHNICSPVLRLNRIHFHVALLTHKTKTTRMVLQSIDLGVIHHQREATRWCPSLRLVETETTK